MTTTLIYKATARYAVGWTDPRGMFNSSGEPLPINNLDKPISEETLNMTTEQLRCAWAIYFGLDWVPFKDIYVCEDRFYVDVAAILNDRKQLSSQRTATHLHPFYKLIPDTDANSR